MTTKKKIIAKALMTMLLLMLLVAFIFFMNVSDDRAETYDTICSLVFGAASSYEINKFIDWLFKEEKEEN